MLSMETLWTLIVPVHTGSKWWSWILPQMLDSKTPALTCKSLPAPFRSGEWDLQRAHGEQEEVLKPGGARKPQPEPYAAQ